MFVERSDYILNESYLKPNGAIMSSQIAGVRECFLRYGFVGPR